MTDHRMAYRRADENTAPLHSTVRKMFMDLDVAFSYFAEHHNLDPHSVALVKTKLDEAVMWANRAVALLGPVDPDPDKPNVTRGQE